MSRAMSIHIGVNHPREPSNAPLITRSEESAGGMAQLALQAGYDSVLALRGKAATVAAVREALARARDGLVRGDTLFVSFSGHGGKVFDRNQDDARDGDAHDETWCLSDAMLLDDDLCEYWRGFQHGVRIVVVSESCYSAGMRRTGHGYEYVPTGAAPQGLPSPVIDGEERRAGAVPPRPEQNLRNGRPEPALRGGRGGQALRGGGAGEVLRDGSGVQAPGVHGGADPRPSCIPAPPRNTDGIAASVLMLTSSGEDQTSRDGVFSRALLNLWEGGSYDGSYCDLYWHLRDHGVRECSQTTHIFMLGAADLDFPLVPAFRPVPSVVLRGG